MMFYIYILYSASSNIFYVGYTSDVERRFFEHNNPVRTKFTAKHLPWLLKVSFAISTDRGHAMKAEKFIKKQKSRKYIERLIDDKTEQERLAQLVRVPI